MSSKIQALATDARSPDPYLERPPQRRVHCKQRTRSRQGAATIAKRTHAGAERGRERARVDARTLIHEDAQLPDGVLGGGPHCAPPREGAAGEVGGPDSVAGGRGLGRLEGGSEFLVASCGRLGFDGRFWFMGVLLLVVCRGDCLLARMLLRMLGAGGGSVRHPASKLNFWGKRVGDSDGNKKSMYLDCVLDGALRSSHSGL